MSPIIVVTPELLSGDFASWLFLDLLRFGCEMFPTGSHVPTLSPQLAALFQEAVEPLRGRASLEKAGHWGVGFEVY